MVSAGIYQVSPEEHDKNPMKKHDYDGMIEVRWTTDILFLILIWCMWGAMSYVGYSGIRNGNPYRLIAPIDSSGNACGFENADYASNRYFYTVSTEGLGTCIPSCPDADASLTSTDINDYYCLPSNNAITVPTDPTLFATYISANCFSTGQFSVSKGFSDGCLCNIKRRTFDQVRRCRFSDPSIRAQYKTQSAPSYLTAFAADIYTARNIIFGFGFGVAIFLSFLWTYLMKIKWLGYIVCWGGLVGTLALMIAFCSICQHTALTWGREDPLTHSEEETLALKIFGWLLLALAILFFCMMVFLRKQINLSIQVLAMAGHAITDMKFIVFTPIISLAAFAIFMVPCIIYMFYVASDGHFDTITATYNSVTFPAGLTYKAAPGVIDRLWYLWFCLLWTMNWIGGMSALVIAVSSAQWYFTADRTHLKVNSFTVLKAYATVIRYHWGTAAFGALLIAIVQFVRWFLLYLQKHYQEIVGARTILKYVCCCIQCCLWCLECCVKFVSKNAYIQTAIHGTSFMTGCKDAFFTIARNIFRVGAVHVVGGISLFIGKIFVVAASVSCSFFFMDRALGKDLNGIVGPLVLIGLIAWLTASMFMDVYHMCMDTLLMCYISDEEAHNGNAKFAEGPFKTFIIEHGKIEPGEHGTNAETENMQISDLKHAVPV